MQDRMLTDADVRAFIKVMDEQEVPQEGRYIEYMGVVYGEGDEFPQDFKDLIERLTA